MTYVIQKIGRLVLLFSWLIAPASAQDAQAAAIQRSTIAGIDVLIRETDVQDVVTLRGSLPAGDALAAGGNVALATLAGGMLDLGTTKRDKFAIAEQLEAVGATISFSVDNDVLNIGAKCLRKDLRLVLELLAEQLRRPAFDPQEFLRLKTRLSGAFRRQLESTDARAREAFNNAVYPPRHPNHTAPVRDFLEALERAELDDVKAFHATHYGPSGMTLVLVGDVDAGAARTALERFFSGWTGGSSIARARRPATLPPEPPAAIAVFMEDKTSVSIVWGQPTGLRHSDPDSLPLRVAAAILGSGFTGRLLANVRDREGLTYGIGALMANDTFNDGDWRIHGTFAPQLLDEGLASTRRQLEAWHQDGVTAAELEARKGNLAGAFKLQLSTTQGLAMTILQTVQRGYDLSWIDEYPEQLQALTLEEVNRVIRRHLQPDRMVLVQAGTLMQRLKD